LDPRSLAGHRSRDDRLPSGFRVPKAEALRLARERIETEAGRKLADRELERLVDELIATNERRVEGG
jgi:hypothetical protein